MVTPQWIYLMDSSLRQAGSLVWARARKNGAVVKERSSKALLGERPVWWTYLCLDSEIRRPQARLQVEAPRSDLTSRMLGQHGRVPDSLRGRLMALCSRVLGR